MGNIYRLVGLKNSELLAGLSALVQRSQEITAEELAHLAEIEDRMLHLELGFASLFAYCVEALGMSEGSAGRRVAAARVCRSFPEAFDRVARGDLHLSALCALSPHLNSENASELLEACQRKTRRQIEELLAARFPRADVREQIRRLPTRAQAAVGVPGCQSAESAKPQNQSLGQPIANDPRHEAAEGERAGMDANRGSSAVGVAQVGVAQVGVAQVGVAQVGVAQVGVAQAGSSSVGSSSPRRREIEALSVDRFGVHFTADAELRELIEQARALASHRLPKGDLANLMKLALKTFVQHEEKRRFAVGRNPRTIRVDANSAPSTPPGGAGGMPEGAPSTPPGGAGGMPDCIGVPPAPPGGVSAPVVSPARKATLPVRSSRTKRRSRHVSAPATREVYLRDRAQCSYVSADGRQCGARAFLQLDHLEPWAALGASVPENLRLLCRAHNLLHARRCFGALHVAAKIAARRG